MLDKTRYSSWASRMLLYIKCKEHCKLLYDSVINGHFKYGTITVPETPTTPTTVRDRTYDEITDAKKIREACDIKATNIVLQGLPQDIYNLVNHHSKAKDIWDRFKLLIEGSEILLHERESKLYDEFDTFTSVPIEIIHSYHLRRFRGDRLIAAFQTDDLDAFDSDFDEAPSANAVLIDMSNQVAKCNEVDIGNKTINESLTTKLERYKDQIKIFKESQKCDLNDSEKYIDSQLQEHDALSVIDAEETLELAEENLVHTAVNSYVAIADYQSMEKSYIEEYDKNLKLNTELSKMNDMVEKGVYNELSNTCSKLEKRCITLEIKLHQSKESFQNNKPCNNQDAPEFQEFLIINELKAQLKAKESSISNQKTHIATLKGKSVSDSNVPVNNANENKEHANSLYRILEQARALNLIEEHLGYACKFTTRIQELLVYVTNTCPSSKVESKKLVAIIPMNKNKKVRFQEPKQSTSTTPTQVVQIVLLLRLRLLQAHDRSALLAHQL
ncbi:hypothetical protein Tco_0569140, partial [Tanacetum coccineum]